MKYFKKKKDKTFLDALKQPVRKPGQTSVSDAITEARNMILKKRIMGE